jgi:propionate CoA-transferase
VGLIRDGDTLATGGFVGIGFAENIAVALEERYLEEGAPRGIGLVYATGQGDGKEGNRGLSRIVKESLRSAMHRSYRISALF